MSTRLLSDADLTTISTRPADGVQQLFANDQIEAARRQAQAVLSAHRKAAVGMLQKQDIVFDWLGENVGVEAVDRVRDDLESFRRQCNLYSLEDSDVSPQPASETVEGLASVRDFTRQWLALRNEFDRFRDELSAIQSSIYRHYGVEALEAVHTTCGASWVEALPAFLEAEPVERLTRLVALLQSIFSAVSIRELPDRWIIAQDPCGTCGRQLRSGRYRLEPRLAVVTERTAMTWHRGETPVYRTHVPIWHVVMSIQQAGVPFPVNQCPVGLASGPCKIVVFKDASNPAAHAEVPDARRG